MTSTTAFPHLTKRQFIKTAATGLCGASLSLASRWSYGSETTDIRMTSRGDTNSNYSIGLIKLAMEKSNKPFKLHIREEDFAPLRQRKELKDGSIDVLWTATSSDMEEEFLPIRIPLYKGLLGHRILILHRDNQHMFDGVTTWNQMLNFTFGQGKSWTDTDIMKANGMKVVPGVKYDNLFYMADGKRFDAFPRGVHEPWSEIDKHPDLDLVVDNNVMMVYRMPFYLFITPGRKQLADDIYNGLSKAVDDGSFDEYFYSNPTVKMVLEKANLKNRKIFELKNPGLPALTPVSDTRLWVDIAKL